MQRRYCSSVWFVRSVCPSISGWKAEDSWMSTPRSSNKRRHNLDANWGPLSDTISSGSPCSRTIPSRINWAVSSTLIDQFRCGLHDDVQDLLLTLVDLSSFSEAITQAIWCDNRLFERHQEKKVTSSAQLWNSRPTTLPLVPQTTPVARPASFGPAPM
jgi:hypothetical protein